MITWHVVYFNGTSLRETVIEAWDLASIANNLQGKGIFHTQVLSIVRVPEATL